VYGWKTVFFKIFPFNSILELTNSWFTVHLSCYVWEVKLRLRHFASHEFPLPGIAWTYTTGITQLYPQALLPLTAIINGTLLSENVIGGAGLWNVAFLLYGYLKHTVNCSLENCPIIAVLENRKICAILFCPLLSSGLDHIEKVSTFPK